MPIAGVPRSPRELALAFATFDSRCPQSRICDAQQYWTRAVTQVTNEYAKDVLVVLNNEDTAHS
jgi:hypothetical protein